MDNQSLFLHEQLRLLVPLAASCFMLVLFGLNLYVRRALPISRRTNVLVALVAVLLTGWALRRFLNPPLDPIETALASSCTAVHAQSAVSATPAFAKVIMWYTHNQDDIGALSSLVNANYAQRHGYHFQRHHDCTTSRAPQWTKIALLYAEVQSSDTSAWVVWIDGDAVFTNFRVRLEQQLNKLPATVNLVMGPDLKELNRPLNTGWMALRRGAASAALMRRLWTVGSERGLKFFWPHEQQSLTWLMESDESVRRQIRIVQNVRMFSEDLSRWRPGDLVAHAAGWPKGPERLRAVKLMAAYAKRSERAN